MEQFISLLQPARTNHNVFFNQFANRAKDFISDLRRLENLQKTISECNWEVKALLTKMSLMQEDTVIAIESIEERGE